MKKLSLVVSTIMLSSTLFAASSFEEDTTGALKKESTKKSEDVTSIDEAFKEGKVSGTIALYGQKVKNDNRNVARNLAYGNGHLGIAYETASFYGLNAKIEAKGNLKLGEQHKHDWKDNAPFENSALITQAYLQYELDNVISLKGGRFEGEYEWLTDYQQGGVIEILPIPDTVIALGYSNKKAESGIDLSEDFHKPDLTNKGVYFLDIQNKSLDIVTFNPYFYEMPDFGNFYGLKVSLDTDFFGINAQYAKSHANSTTYIDENGNDYKLEDGYIANLELVGKISDFEATLGYAKTSDKGGANMITAFGDSISPFEDGNYFYDLDAKTSYVNLTYSIFGVDLGALYGITKYSDGTDKFKEKELNLSVAYGFTDNLSAGLMWVNVDTNNSNDTKYNKYLASVEYSF